MHLIQYASSHIQNIVTNTLQVHGIIKQIIDRSSSQKKEEELQGHINTKRMHSLVNQLATQESIKHHLNTSNKKVIMPRDITPIIVITD
jgi:hypothetical protein